MTHDAGGPGRRARVHAQLLESIARGVRSGLSLTIALDGAVGDVTASCGTDAPCIDARIVEALRRHRAGAPLADCLAVARAESRSDEQVRLTLTVLWIAAGHGGPSAEALDRAAVVLREHAALADDARTHAAPARLSATVLTLSPIIFCGGAAALDADVRRILVSTPIGWVCIVCGSALAALGRRWMSHLVRAAA